MAKIPQVYVLTWLPPKAAWRRIYWGGGLFQSYRDGAAELAEAQARWPKDDWQLTKYAAVRIPLG